MNAALENFKCVKTIDLKDNNIRPELRRNDDETADNEPGAEENSKKVYKNEGNEPDIRQEADDNRTVRATPTPPPSKPKSFFDFFRRKSNAGTPQPGQSPEKKKHFLFF